MLENMYPIKTGNNLILLKEMTNLGHREGTPVLAHINDFQGFVDQMSDVGIKFDDEILGIWLLNSLPDSWKKFRTSYTNNGPDDAMYLRYARDDILKEEVRLRKSNYIIFLKRVFVIEDMGRSPNKNHGKRGKSRSKSYQNTECH